MLQQFIAIGLAYLVMTAGAYVALYVWLHLTVNKHGGLTFIKLGRYGMSSWVSKSRKGS